MVGNEVNLQIVPQAQNMNYPDEEPIDAFRWGHCYRYIKEPEAVLCYIVTTILWLGAYLMYISIAKSNRNNNTLPIDNLII